MGATHCSFMPDIVNVQMRFENDCIANIAASRITQNEARSLAISQRDSYIFLDFTDLNIQIHRCEASTHRLDGEDLQHKIGSSLEQIFVHKENPIKPELKHFIERCASPETKRVSVERELSSLRLANQIMNLIR